MSSDKVVSAEKFTSYKNIVVKKEPLETVSLTDCSGRNYSGGPVVKQTHSPVDPTNHLLDGGKVCVKNRLTQIFHTPAAASTSAAPVSLSSGTIPKKESMFVKTSKKQLKRLRTVCFICNENFIKRNELIWHRVFAHGFYAKKCEECGKKMTNKKKLRRHLRVHHPHMLVSCDVCGHGFCETKDLRKHYSKMHQGKSYRNWYVPTFENSASGSSSMENNDIPSGPTVKAEITDVCDSKNTSCDTISCNENSKFQSIKAEPMDESDRKNTDCDSVSSNQKSKMQLIKVEPMDESDLEKY